MFTGIVAKMGTVVSRRGRVLKVRAPLGRLPRGESVAVNGVCLTVVGRPGAVLSFDVSPETDRLTDLRSLGSGDRVNLELPLRLGSRLGGHLVSGHVDSCGRIVSKQSLPGGFVQLRVRCPAPLRPYVARKGSVAVDGVSLTVTGVGRGWFECQLIPETLSRTTLGLKGPGACVNLEADLVARHVVHVLMQGRRR
ncbi:MAG: riboflavin synthase [Elusimicrobia bacterium]|nr:riboflavin synthase [Elusimicrobiota bacterium]